MRVLLLMLLTTIVGCEAQETEPQSTKSVVKQIPNRVPVNMIGNYKHHLGEEAEGTVSITSDEIIIDVIGLRYNLEVQSEGVVLRPWCQDKILDIKLTDYKDTIIKITDYTDTQGYIVISLNNNVIGVYDKILPVQFN